MGKYSNVSTKLIRDNIEKITLSNKKKEFDYVVGLLTKDYYLTDEIGLVAKEAFNNIKDGNIHGSFKTLNKKLNNLDKALDKIEEYQKIEKKYNSYNDDLKDEDPKIIEAARNKRNSYKNEMRLLESEIDNLLLY